MHDSSFPLADKTVKVSTPGILQLAKLNDLRGATDPDATEVEYWIEDWQDRVFGFSWGDEKAIGNPACLQYAIRGTIPIDNLPDDDECVYGKINNLGYIVHVSELGEFVRDGR